MEQKRAEYREDIDIYLLASELVVDAVIPGEELRDELIKRFNIYRNKEKLFSRRHNMVIPG